MVGLQKGNSNGNRGANKPYGLMLLLAFGAALLGVMMIHKLRERRIFNLLVKEKDHQLISLQLLLQKEREYTKEMKRKAEEMKTKIYSLRNQNMETDRRILEMQSTIRSLKDERKILESALEERQNAIKANRKKITGREKEKDPRVTALMESLKQKEAEIEDLKRRLESNVGRSSEKYLSNGKPNVNVTGNSVVTETTANRSASGTGELYEFANYSNGVNPLERGNRGIDASASTVESENADRFGNRTESKGGLRVNGENNAANAAEKLVNTGDTDSGMRSTHGQEQTVAIDEQMGYKNSKQDKGQDEGTLKGGRKLEMTDKSRTSNARLKGKYAKEMLQQKLHRNRRLVNNRNDETESSRKRKFPVDNQNQLRDSEEATTFEDFSNAELLKSQKSDDSKDVKNIPVIENTVHHLEKLQVHGSSDNEADGTRSNATTESYESDLDGVRQYESQENYSRDMKMQVNDVTDEMQEANEAADADNGIDKATGEFDTELVPDFEENKDDYKEETAEDPEF